MIRSSRLIVGVAGLFLMACVVVTAQEPPKKEGPPAGKVDPRGKGKGGFQKGGPGGGDFRGFQRTKPGTVLAVSIQETLKMTDEQKKEIESLQKMVDEKLAKILTEEQQKQLKEMGEGRGGFGGRPLPKKDN